MRWRRSLTGRGASGKLPAMIISTGVDLAEVARIQKALEDLRIGARFRRRIFTEKEIAYCETKRRGKYQSDAGRFAAKEAVMKALGRGWGATGSRSSATPAIGRSSRAAVW